MKAVEEERASEKKVWAMSAVEKDEEHVRQQQLTEKVAASKEQGRKEAALQAMGDQRDLEMEAALKTKDANYAALEAAFRSKEAEYAALEATLNSKDADYEQVRMVSLDPHSIRAHTHPSMHPRNPCTYPLTHTCTHRPPTHQLTHAPIAYQLTNSPTLTLCPPLPKGDR
jgi:hypothetical protein